MERALMIFTILDSSVCGSRVSASPPVGSAAPGPDSRRGVVHIILPVISCQDKPTALPASSDYRRTLRGWDGMPSGCGSKMNVALI